MKSFIKKNIKFIIIVVICITCSVLTTFATDYLFNSSEVYYNNTTSGIQADKVQGAIDELYACASNYAAYNQRLTSAETTIGSGSLTTTSQNLIGAVNGLNEQIATLNNSLIVGNNVTVTASSGTTFNTTVIKRFGKIVIGYFKATISVGQKAEKKLGSVSNNGYPGGHMPVFPFYTASDAAIHSQIYIKTNGDIMIYNADDALSNKAIECSVAYFVS